VKLMLGTMVTSTMNSWNGQSEAERLIYARCVTPVLVLVVIPEGPMGSCTLPARALRHTLACREVARTLQPMSAVRCKLG
jgi:hypothetical protein